LPDHRARSALIPATDCSSVPVLHRVSLLEPHPY
jgi:hypothetical protein